ncbi:MAG: hypothetical protein J6Q47_00230 [Paludibacteraceae bacterium]|nr:hypothetical protein [Paludibacteraceae bacterium]
MNNYRYTEFINACKKEGIAPSVWAEKNGIGNSMPTNLKNGVRPSIDTLKKMVSCWSDSDSGINILIAHLKDEIESAGSSLDEISISKSGEKHDNYTLADDLKTVQLFMNKKPIRESMHSLAVLLKASEWAQEEDMVELLKQAEDSATMQRARRRKSKTA